MCKLCAARQFSGFLEGSQWSELNIGYWFPQSSSEYSQDADTYGEGELAKGFEGMDAEAQEFFVGVLDMYASVCGLTFSEDADGEIWIGYSENLSLAHAYLPDSGGDQSGDVWFNSQTYFEDFEAGHYSGFVAIHELGHALGLVHTHDFDDLPEKFDQMSFSVMSYNSSSNHNAIGYTNGLGDYAQSLMSLDILALQSRYGINYEHQSGDTVYTFDPVTGEMSINGVGQLDGSGNTIFRTLWDGAGEDLVDLSNFYEDCDINLNAGGSLQFSQRQLAQLSSDGTTADANVFLSFDPDGSGECLIENVNTGRGNDMIKGNSANNNIDAGDGENLVLGGIGDDILIGGASDDILRGGHGDDILIGGNGSNTLVGGLGEDRFVFFDEENSNTTIRDYDPNQDILIFDALIDMSETMVSFSDGNCVLVNGDIQITILDTTEDNFDLSMITQEDTNLIA